MPELPSDIDTSRPHSARVYDYMIGGKNNFAADRETAAQVLKHSRARRRTAKAADRTGRLPRASGRPCWFQQY